MKSGSFNAEDFVDRSPACDHSVRRFGSRIVNDFDMYSSSNFTRKETDKDFDRLFAVEHELAHSAIDAFLHQNFHLLKHIKDPAKSTTSNGPALETLVLR